MTAKIDTATIKIWDQEVGAVAWLADQSYALFEYAPDFLRKHLDISPINMSINAAMQGDARFSFAELNKATFSGLPGLLADAMPDKFGQEIINTWLARKGRDPASFNPIERLCYMGKRGMGALEFLPASNKKFDRAVAVEISDLVALSQTVMNKKSSLNAEISQDEKENAEAIIDILRVGTSAGGARPKAIIAMNEQGHVLSGQAQVPEDYEHWLLKFDGVTDLELGEPHGYGRIEYAYYLMSKAAGIGISESHLLEESGRAHFITKRFDRVCGKKVHMQSLCGIAHFDFNMAGAYSYEQAFAIMRQLALSKVEIIEQYRRMIFSVIARNLDDHTKNIAFLMTEDGQWTLSPAYDMTYAHNPAGKWTSQHQMSLNGKRDNFSRQDLIAVADTVGIIKAEEIIDSVGDAVKQWPTFAASSGVKKSTITSIAKAHKFF